MSGSAASDRLDAAADAVAGQVIAWRRHLHQHPELSDPEVKTANLIAEQLRSPNIDRVRTGIAGHGVGGVLKGGRPGDRMIALRADNQDPASSGRPEHRGARDRIADVGTASGGHALEYRVEQPAVLPESRIAGLALLDRQ